MVKHKKMWCMYEMEYYSAINKEWNYVICSNIDEPRYYHTEWRKSDTKLNTWYCLYVESKKKKGYTWTYLRNRLRSTDVENKFTVTSGVGGRENLRWRLVCTHLGLPCSSNTKESACNAEDPGLIPGLGKSSEEGNGNPLQYYCLENPMDTRAWKSTVRGTVKSRTRLKQLTLHYYCWFS